MQTPVSVRWESFADALSASTLVHGGFDLQPVHGFCVDNKWPCVLGKDAFNYFMLLSFRNTDEISPERF